MARHNNNFIELLLYMSNFSMFFITKRKISCGYKFIALNIVTTNDSIHFGMKMLYKNIIYFNNSVNKIIFFYYKSSLSLRP